MVTSFERRIRLKEIADTLRKLQQKERDLDEGEFVYLICAKYSVSRRVAKEYIEIAKREAKCK